MNNDLERLRGLAEAAKHDEHFTTTEAVDYMCAAKPQLIIDIIDRLRAAESELANCKAAWALVSTERYALATRLEAIEAQEPCGYVAGSSFVKERPSYQTSADWSPVYEQKPAVHVWPNVPYGALVEHNQKLMRELEELRKQDADTEVQHPALHIDDNGAVAYSVGYDGPLNGEFYAIPQSKEFMEACAQICDQEAEEWDSDNVVTEKNYAAACATRIRALLSGSPTPDQCPSHESGQDEIEGY